MRPYILAINPGSTSTKIAVYERERALFEETIRHTPEELAPYEHVMQQYAFRKRILLAQMGAHDITPENLCAVVGRGGLVRPVESGTYTINDTLLNDLRAGVGGMHASNLGGLIAHEIAREQGIPSYIVDPPVVDEMQDIARLSGFPGIARESRFHALNQRAAGHKAARALHKRYEECKLVIAHMGGGISVTAHAYGRAIDTNNGVDSEGSYTPERAGTIPVAALIRLCYSGEYSLDSLSKAIVFEAGLKAYLGTNDAREIVARIAAGDEEAKRVYEGMGYQIAKEIGAYAVVLQGEVDAICLTGGLAHDGYLTGYIAQMVGFLAPVLVFPGEDELRALVEGVLRVMEGEEEAKTYCPLIKE